MIKSCHTSNFNDSFAECQNSTTVTAGWLFIVQGGPYQQQQQQPPPQAQGPPAQQPSQQQPHTHSNPLSGWFGK